MKGYIVVLIGRTLYNKRQMYQFHKSDRFPYLLQLSPTKTGSIRVFYATEVVLGSS